MKKLMMYSMTRSLCALFVSFVLVGCAKQEQSGASQAASGASHSAAASKGASGASGKSGGKRASPVITVTVASSVFTDETEALGTAKSNESVDITAKATNRVVAIHFREGEYVKKDAVIVELDGAEARANLAQAQASLRDTESQYQRSRELYQTKVLSESDLIQLEAKMLSSKAQVAAAESRLSDTIIRAPFAGRVGLRNVSVGSLVTPGQIMTTLDDINVIKLDFTVPESYLATVKEGQQVEAKTSAYLNKTFRGRVSSIATRVDPVSRSAVVRALIDNREQQLKPGMFMTVHLARSQSNVLLIPEQALMPDGDKQFVYVVKNSTATKTSVLIGRRKPGQVEVKQGLSVGDEVVIEGGEKLTNGAQVSVATGDRSAEPRS